MIQEESFIFSHVDSFILYKVVELYSWKIELYHLDYELPYEKYENMKWKDKPNVIQLVVQHPSMLIYPCQFTSQFYRIKFWTAEMESKLKELMELTPKRTIKQIVALFKQKYAKLEC